MSMQTEIKELGEFRLIERLTENFISTNSSTIKGVGDDAAVINPQGQTVVTTDLLLEGIHFDLAYVPLKHLGYKAVAVNLSDVCAMNAIPKQITFSIGLSSRFPVEAVEELYKGIAHACKFYEVDLIGGDTTASVQGLVISVTAIGEAPTEKLAYRNDAKENDIICVTGDLGGAYIGLQLLEREKQIHLENPAVQPDLEGQKYIVGRQLKPEARKDIVLWLHEKDLKPTAMIDVSDGLSSDLLHICKQSMAGAEIQEKELPIHNDTYEAAINFGIEPTTCILNGGEDYELLFTVDPSHKQLVEEHPDIHLIGRITAAEKGAKLISKAGTEHDLVAQGWNSLRDK